MIRVSNLHRLIATALLVTSNLAAADPIVIGDSEGALYDGIIDGYPGIVTFDGEPDLGNNALGITLKAGVTEERAIVELPLASVISVGSMAATATFTFNIDDVLASTGPGTEFAGRACRQISLHTYDGNGQIDLLDFKRIQSTGHTIVTSASGDITDATLARTGPVRFDVDVTGDLNLQLAAGASHLGIVLRCTDSPTGTSLDNLGDGSAGPPGINGSFLPYLTVMLAGPATATPSPSSSPSPSPTPSLAATATSSPVATATSTVPSTATPSATMTATNTATVAFTAGGSPTATPPPPPCRDDCDGDGRVSPSELVRLIGDAIAGRPSTCPNAGGVDLVTIDQIIVATTQAQTGCATTAAEPIRP